MKAFDNYTFLHTEETDSTNNLVRCGLSISPEKEFIVATTDFQTAGRGQRGNSWESERGKNLLFSILCKPTFLNANQQFVISQAISLSIKNVFSNYHSDFNIKWPNDIYWQEKKIGGILIENDLAGKRIATSIIGVGLNLNQQEFRSDAPNPISLWQITKQEQNSQEILLLILKQFEIYYQQLKAGQTEEITNQYTNALLWKNGYHLFEDNKGTFYASIHQIEPDGRIVLQDTEMRLRAYYFKEVRYIFD